MPAYAPRLAEAGTHPPAPRPRHGSGRSRTSHLPDHARNLKESRTDATREYPRTRSTVRSRPVPLDDEHRIAVRIEAVPFLDRDPVGPHHVLVPAERGDEHEERRAREVEVREESVDGPEPVRRADEEIGPPRSRPHGPVLARDRLQRA